jgi:glutamine amidotransferase
MLGICLGMQLLAQKGYEGGEQEGLGILPGEVRRLYQETPETRIPHVGWNEVHEVIPSTLFEAIPSGTDFYFVHSYHLIPSVQDVVVATTPYGKSFVSAVQVRNVFGVQFHPEKSSRPGFQIIRNFLKM